MSQQTLYTRPRSANNLRLAQTVLRSGCSADLEITPPFLSVFSLIVLLSFSSIQNYSKGGESCSRTESTGTDTIDKSNQYRIPNSLFSMCGFFKEQWHQQPYCGSLSKW